MNTSRSNNIAIRFLIALFNIITWPAKFLWRKRKIFGWAVFILIIVHSIAVMYLARRVDSEIAKIKAKGDPVSMADLAGKPVPDSLNSWPIYKEIFKEMKKLSKDSDYVRWNKVSSNEERLKAINGEDKNANASLKQLIAKHKSVFSLLDEAVKRPYYRDDFDYNWDKAGASETFFKRIANFRQLARLLVLKSQLNAYDGNKRAAIEDAKKMFLVADVLKEAPTLVCHLVRIAILAIADKNINVIASVGAIDNNSARELDLFLSNISLDGTYESALKTERVTVINGIRNQILKNTGYIGRPYIYMNELYYLENVQKQIDDSLSKPRTNEMFDNKFYILAEIGLDLNYKVGKKVSESIAMRDGTCVFLGLIAYKDKYGLYPKTLDELKTKLNWKVKNDSCSGKPFIYKSKENGFILYSIGENGKDDGGRKGLDFSWEMDK